MSLLDAHSEDLIAAAEQAPTPMQRKEPPKRFSTWGMFAAAPKGVAAGAAEGTASTADILGAFGQVLSTTGGSGKGMFAVQTPEERKQSNAATDKLLNSGIDYNSEAGRSFRNVSAAYTPDAQTTHVAESAVFNLFRVGSKALTSAATLGNIPGAVVAGVEEGFTQADQLGQQGVDLATRSKVGAVTAVTNAVGFALPAAGKTWLQTGALALAGGPVSFVAQNAATREILQAADYSKQADQYDPLDPVGLGLSFVVPWAVGALAMRGAKVKSGATVPDAPKIAPPDDLVDAARVQLVRQNMDGTNPLPGDLGAADAHHKAYTQAMDQQAAGERVQVDVPEAVAVKASQDMAARVDAMRAEVAKIEADIPPNILQQKQPMAPVEPSPIATKTVAQEPGFNPAALANEASQMLEGGRPVAQVIGELEAGGTKVTPELQNMLVGASEFGGRINELVDQVNALKAQRGPSAQPFDLIAQAVENLRSGTKVDAPKPINPLEARLADMEVRNPTALDAAMHAGFDDQGKPTGTMTARDYLDMIKKEAANDSADASLLEVAANCFLAGGV